MAAIEAAADCETVDQVRQEAVERTARLIPGVSCSWTELNPESGLTHGAINIDLDPGRITREMARVAHQHPVIGHFLKYGDGRARAISDFLSRSRFQALDLYQSFYARYDTEDQLSVATRHEGWVVGLVVNRGEWGFAESERAILNALRSTFFSSFRRLKKLSEYALASEGLDDGRDHIAVFQRALSYCGLSRREAEVMAWVAEGKSNQEIAGILELSPGTIRKHVERVFKQLHVTSRAAATRAAFQRVHDAGPGGASQG